MKLPLTLFMLAATTLTLAQSTENRIRTNEEAIRNQKQYNSEEHQRVESNSERMDKMRETELREMAIGQGVQDQRLRTLEDSELQAKAIRDVAYAVIPTMVVLALAYFKWAGKDTVPLTARVAALEKDSIISSSKMGDLVIRMGELMQRSLVTDLHHNETKYAATDNLLDKLNDNALSPAEDAKLHELLKERATDPAVSEVEQGKARDLPIIIQLVKELKAEQSAAPVAPVAPTPNGELIKFRRKDEQP